MTGVVTGSLQGVTPNGVTVQLTVNTGKGFSNGSVMLASGNSNIKVVPEPGTLGLLGTGLLGIAGMLHRKFKR